VVHCHASDDWNIIPEGSCRSSGSRTPRPFRPRRSAGGRHRSQRA
jgi:hypothetical protein